MPMNAIAGIEFRFIIYEFGSLHRNQVTRWGKSDLWFGKIESINFPTLYFLSSATQSKGKTMRNGLMALWADVQRH